MFHHVSGACLLLCLHSEISQPATHNYDKTNVHISRHYLVHTHTHTPAQTQHCILTVLAMVSLWLAWLVLQATCISHRLVVV